MAETTDTWTIRAALDWTSGYLARKGDENPRLSAEWLLAEACGMRRVELYVNFDRPLSMPERDVLRAYVSRRGKGEPLQYITGEAPFRHIALKVRPGVLIPRPETEVLVSELLAMLPAPARRVARDSRIAAWEGDILRDAQGADGTGAAHGDAAPQQEAGASKAAQPLHTEADRAELLIADLCTGTGCIACSIAYERPDARLIATDVSDAAVALAQENAQALGLADRIEVCHCDLAEGIDRELWGRFDALVSNPPYVPSAELADIPGEVADFEPALALDGGEDGLEVFRRELIWCDKLLKPGGVCAFELHESCLEAAADLAREAGLASVRTVCDLAGRPRVLTACKER